MHPFLISSFISERDAKFSNALKIKYLELIRLNENHFDQFTDSIRLLTKVYADKMFKKPTLPLILNSNMRKICTSVRYKFKTSLLN